MFLGLAALILLHGVHLSSGCPLVCRCSLDEKGRQRVQCEKGGMTKAIPVNLMGKDTEVLIITAPKFNENRLSLGPIFKQLLKLEEIQITYSVRTLSNTEKK